MRKSVFDKITTYRLEEMARDDFYGGPGWGAAESRAIRVKQYLTKELTEKILAKQEEVRQYWKAKLDAIPKSKRFDCYGDLVAELHDGDVWLFRDRKENEVFKVADNMLYTGAIKTGRFPNGRYWAEIVKDAAEMPIDFGYYVNTGWGYRSTYSQDHLKLYWDAEKQLYYLVTFRRSSTEAIPENKRKRNWARSTKRNEFVRKFMSMAREIASECGGLTIANGKISAWKPTKYAE